MAEIKVEKKNYTWLWILLGVLVLGVIIYFVAFHNKNEETYTSPELNVISTEEAVNLARTENHVTTAFFAV